MGRLRDCCRLKGDQRQPNAVSEPALDPSQVADISGVARAARVGSEDEMAA